MLKKQFILVLILSFYVGWLNSGKAIVPFQVCEKYIDIAMTYEFNTTVNNSDLKGPEHLHSEIQDCIGQECTDPLLKVLVSRTLGNIKDTNGSYEITADYTVTVGINETYYYNYSALRSGIENKVADCFEATKCILNPDRLMYVFRITVSGKEIKPDVFTDDTRANDACKKTNFFQCPALSAVKVNNMCECRKGWHLKNVSSGECTKCPKDTYQEKTGMFNCTKCTPGYTTSNETGRTNRTACTLPVRNTTTPMSCSKGRYLNITSNTCIPCPINTYQDIPGETPCKNCPQGLKTSGTGANNLSLCIANIQNTPAPEGRDGILTIVLAICIIVAVVIAGLIFLVFRIKIKKERERKARDMEEFRRNFIKRNETTNDYLRPDSPDEETTQDRRNFHVTTNTTYRPDSSDEETTEDELSTLGHLAEDVAKRNLEIPRDCITITHVRLGRGQFGEVKQAVVRKPDEPEILCAAKMARGSRVPLEDMVDELEIHLKLEGKHENVVNLIGVCSSGGPFYLILEYCENGSLVDYLRKHESTGGYVNIMADGEIVMTLEWKQSRVLEICNGMKYLAKHRIVHRDLAARNILLDRNTVAKISDFGMSKDVYMKSYYTQKSAGCFPVRWMAMESLKSFTFNEKTDVWSFGVLVWEIYTNGHMPYYDIINDEKAAYKILNGKKLKQPEDCPKFMYSMMLRCWSNKSFNRPSFAQLHHTLTQHIQQQPKQGARRFSRDILRRFGESSNSLKRKLSRKGSSEPHTSSRRPSRDSLDGFGNDMELQRHEPLEKILDADTAPRKDEGNPDVGTLDEIEEDKLVQHPNDEDRSGIKEAPHDSSKTNEISPQQNINPNVKRSTNEGISVPRNDIKDVDSDNNSETNFHTTPNFQTPNDSLNTNQGSEKVDNSQNENVHDESTTNSTDNLRKGSPNLMNMIDDVLGVDQRRRDSANHLDSMDSLNSDTQNGSRDFPTTTEGNTLPKSENGSAQSSEDGRSKIDEGLEVDTNHEKTPEEFAPTIPDNEHCTTTDLDDLSDESTEDSGDKEDAKQMVTNGSLPQTNLEKNEENSADKVKDEDDKSSSDGSDFLSDVLNAVNVSE